MSGTVTSIKPDNDLRNRVMAPAESRKRKPHWILCEAIREYVEKEEKQQRCWEEAMASWQDFQQSGLHLTFEEVDSWLAQLEAGNDVEPPKCHKQYLPNRQ